MPFIANTVTIFSVLSALKPEFYIMQANMWGNFIESQNSYSWKRPLKVI